MRIRRANRAQIFSEYAITIAMVASVFIAMTVFLKRTLQGRVKDARNTMIDMVRTESNVTIPYEYEPYYLQQNADMTRTVNDAKSLSAGVTTGVFRAIYNESTAAQTQSTQRPAKDAD